MRNICIVASSLALVITAASYGNASPHCHRDSIPISTKFDKFNFEYDGNTYRSSVSISISHDTNILQNSGLSAHRTGQRWGVKYAYWMGYTRHNAETVTLDMCRTVADKNGAITCRAIHTIIDENIDIVFPQDVFIEASRQLSAIDKTCADFNPDRMCALAILGSYIDGDMNRFKADCAFALFDSADLNRRDNREKLDRGASFLSFLMAIYGKL